MCPQPPGIPVQFPECQASTLFLATLKEAVKDPVRVFFSPPAEEVDEGSEGK